MPKNCWFPQVLLTTTTPYSGTAIKDVRSERYVFRTIYVPRSPNIQTPEAIMSHQPEKEEDPLIAALPPETDYFTYLTLLEYQLKAGNLPTLTRLLTVDDGTLAQEIGWGLPKLILPLLDKAPEDATKCLEVVARRGNPREVLIQVAEALENLAVLEDSDSSGPDQSFDDEEDDETLPTFAGEAERIHLGRLTLGEMPPLSASGQEESGFSRPDEDSSSTIPTPELSLLEFRILLSMLSILHPRITTMHPSRFLANSLPAALTAYRRLQVDTTATSCFLDSLGKLSGKRRPNLPPRSSNASVNQSPTVSMRPDPIYSAPLPDPEAKTETESTSETSRNERAIIRRLLQAVMLEVLDEYVHSFEATDLPSMSWAIRLRERYEPDRVLPGRQTETQQWNADQSLKERDITILNFLQLSKDLEVDASELFVESFGPGVSNPENVETEESTETESSSEFPTSPSQIPFSKAGTILLFAARQNTIELAASKPPDTFYPGPVGLPDFWSICGAFTHSIESPESGAPSSLPVLDAALSLLYNHIRLLGPGSSFPSELATSLSPLASLCAECPDPQLRDSAHAVASSILHKCPDPEVKVSFLKHVLGGSQPANLRAIAVNWLKDELLSFAVRARTPTNGTIPQPSSVPTVHEGNITSKTASIGLDPAILTTEPALILLLFLAPDDQKPESSIAVSDVRFYIATLNLVDVLISNHKLREALSNSEFNIQAKGRSMLVWLETWRGRFAGREKGFADDTGAQMIDIWSLDDAMDRVRTTLASNGSRSSDV